ncbi:transposase [Halomonas sp. FME16]|uniref:Transposase n=1 Tax=Halomonas citrativorans TaxID=2742612 RepID=A0ABR9FEB2_9GAMM|nr:transposase [Halomonas citrativorans]
MFQTNFGPFLLPTPQVSARGGRSPIAYRTALTGIVFVLRSGIPWRILPQKIGVVRASPAGDDDGIGSKQVYGMPASNPLAAIAQR